MFGHREKSKQQTMDAELKCRKCRKGALFNTSTKNYCYDCQRINSSRPYGEAKITCRGCKGVYPVPPKTTIYRCPACQTINTSSISGNGQSNKDRGNEMRLMKLGARNLLHDDLSENANQNACVTDHRSSSFSPIGSSFLSRRAKKRAVLCGVTYRKRKFRLKGTINDVINMKELLVKVFDFPGDCIRVLTEQEQSPNLVPTKNNILESLKWLVEGCQSGDSLVFYFSGHGLQHSDWKEDEIDAMDESICPVDFLREGTILDNEINSILVWPLQKGVTLHTIVDACHSGTILDLTYVYDPERCNWKANKPPAREPIRKHTSGGLAICISACEDSQTAADTTAFRGKGMNGAMTYLFTKIIKQNPQLTYEDLLQKMGEEIKDVIRNSCRPTFLQHFFRPRISQDLVISSSEKFDVSKRIFAL